MFHAFFQHGNQAWPSSLSKNGSLRIPENKSDLVDILEPMCLKVGNVTNVDANIFDGSVLILSLNSKIMTEKQRKDFNKNA